MCSSDLDFPALRQSIQHLFSDEGRPAAEPVLCLKLELIMFHDGLSDRQVFAKTKTDIAYRMFLGLGRNDHLPDVSTLRGFRNRLGVEGHQRVFHALLSQARAHGLVKDRLRIKDATHVLADIARVEHLRDILEWATKLSPPKEADSDANWQTLQKSLEIAQKAMNGHDEPQASGKLRSIVDPDARRGRHCGYYDGCFVDVLIDADSELFTAIDVLPADGDAQ